MLEEVKTKDNLSTDKIKIDAALEAALARGWSIVPVKLDKSASVKWMEFQGRRPSREEVDRWAAREPAGWAVITGEISNLVIGDFDGAAGNAILKSLGIEPHMRTGGGGHHVYFKRPPWRVPTLNAKSKKALGAAFPGVDVRGDGGYAIFAGRNEKGEYVLLRDPTDLEPIEKLPMNLRELIGLARAPAVLIDVLLERALEMARRGEGRNDSGFWLATQIRDNGYSQADAEAALARFVREVPSTNAKGEPEPYTSDEALNSVRSAYSGAARQPWTTTGAENREEPSAQRAAVPWPDPLAEEAFHGLAGQIVRVIEPESEADPAALLIQILIAFGNFVGRQPHAVVEDNIHNGNLFAVLVGETSKARKGTSLGRVRGLFKRIEPPLGPEDNLVDLGSWEGNRIVSGLSSGEGLIWAVRDPIYKFEKVKKGGTPEWVMNDPGVTDKRLLVVEPEFGRVLKVMQREGSTLSAVVRTAWDLGTLKSLTKNSPAEATGAHISIIGHITSEELRAALDATEAANGFANRFLFLCVKRSKCLPEGGRGLEEDTIATLAGKLKDAADAARGLGEIHRDQAARQRWAEVYEALSEGRPGLYGSVTGRAESQALRLSVLYALLDGSRQVQIPHLEAALAVWRYCDQSARWIFGDSLGDHTADAILAALRASANGLSRTEVNDLFGGHKATTQIQRALALLLSTRRAVRVDVSTGGRSREVWRAT